MARKAQTTLEDQEVFGGMTVEELSPDNIPMTMFNKFGGKELLKDTPNMVFRDMAYLGKDYLISGIGQLAQIEALNNIVPLEKLDQATVSKAFDAAITVAQPLYEVQQAFAKDVARRQKDLSELDDYTDAGMVAMRSSVATPKGKADDNYVLAKRDQQLTTQFVSDVWKAAPSLIISAAQYYAKDQFGKARDEKLDDLKQSKVGALQEKLDNLDKNNDKFETLQEKGLKSIERVTSDIDAAKGGSHILSKELFNKGGEKITINGDKEQFQVYENFVNPSMLTIFGAAVATSSMKEGLNGAKEKSGSNVIAYDLIMELNKIVMDGDIDNGSIDVSRFRSSHKTHCFHTISDNTNEVTVSEFVREIFHQYVHDNGHEGISKRHDEKMDDLCDTLADHITGKEVDVATGATMHTLALIKLVGDGEVVSPDGHHVATEAIVARAAQDMREQMPFETPVDVKGYMMDLGQSGADLKETLAYLPKEQADFLTYLLPTDVATEAVGMSNKAVREAKARVHDDVMDNVKDMVGKLDALDDKALKAQDLSTPQIKLIRKTSEYIKQGEDTRLGEAIRNTGSDGLPFALISAQEQWAGLKQDTAQNHDMADQAKGLLSKAGVSLPDMPDPMTLLSGKKQELEHKGKMKAKELVTSAGRGEE